MRPKKPKSGEMIRRTRAGASRLYAASSQSELGSRLPVRRPAKQVEVAQQDSHISFVQLPVLTLLRGFSWPHCETPASIWSSSRGSSLTWQQTDFLFRVDLTPNSVSVCVRPESDFNANSADARPAAQLFRLVAVDLCHVITCGQKFCKETEFNFYFLVVLTSLTVTVLSLSHHWELKVDLVPHLPSAPLPPNTDQQSRTEYLQKTLGSHKIMSLF